MQKWLDQSQIKKIGRNIESLWPPSGCKKRRKSNSMRAVVFIVFWLKKALATVLCTFFAPAKVSKLPLLECYYTHPFFRAQQKLSLSFLEKVAGERDPTLPTPLSQIIIIKPQRVLQHEGRGEREGAFMASKKGDDENGQSGPLKPAVIDGHGLSGKCCEQAI